MKVLHLGDNNMFEFEGETFTLHRVHDDGGLNWRRQNGHYALGQHCYTPNRVTVEYVEKTMSKYLIRN